MRMIADFIKSWIYYPKLKSYWESKGFSEFDTFGNRWRYAKWHCRCGMMKENQNCPEAEEDRSDGWTGVYDRQPIKNMEF